MEPTSTSIASVLISKLTLSAGGLFGGGFMGALWKPAALDGFGKYARGLIIGGIAGVTPAMTGGFIATLLGFDPNSTDVLLFFGTVIGVFALALFILLRNYLVKIEGKDIFEAAQDVRSQVSRSQQPAKVLAKKVVKKTPARKNAK